MKKISFIVGVFLFSLLALQSVSSQESGVSNPDETELLGYSGPPYFEDYQDWDFGSYNSNDNMGNFLLALSEYHHSGINVSVSPNPHSLVDINGDGLVDFLYHTRFRWNGIPFDYTLALFINDGNNNFKLIYRCAIRFSNAWGNCVTGAPPIEEEDVIWEVISLLTYSLGGFAPASNLADINGDGLIDILTNQSSSGVLLNKGNLKFESE